MKIIISGRFVLPDIFGFLREIGDHDRPFGILQTAFLRPSCLELPVYPGQDVRKKRKRCPYDPSCDPVRRPPAIAARVSAGIMREE